MDAESLSEDLLLKNSKPIKSLVGINEIMQKSLTPGGGERREAGRRSGEQGESQLQVLLEPASGQQLNEAFSMLCQDLPQEVNLKVPTELDLDEALRDYPLDTLMLKAQENSRQKLDRRMRGSKLVSHIPMMSVKDDYS